MRLTRIRPRLRAVASLALVIGAATVAHAQLTPLSALDTFAAHLDAAAVLLEAGHTDGAVGHLQVARDQLLPTLRSTTDAAPALEAALRQAERAVGAGDVAGAREAADAAAQAADDAAATLRNDPSATRASLVALTRDARREGVEAAETGEAEALAFAVALSRRATDAAAAADESDDVRQALRALAASLAGNVDGATVSAAGDAALAALGARPERTDVARYFAAIRDDLGAAADAYQGGDPEAASEKLIDAYLENFEYLEAPLQKVDPDLKERLEGTLRDDLRAMVANGAAPSELRAAIDEALKDLSRARQELE